MNDNRTQGTQPNAQTSTLRPILQCVTAIAWLGMLAVTIAVLSLVRDMDKALGRANDDLRRNAANATSANLDR